MAGKKMEAGDRRLAILEAIREADQAVHESMPPGGNANHERAQQKLAELRKLIQEDA